MNRFNNQPTAPMTGHSGHAGPTAVILTVDEGDGIMAEMELIFGSRWKAEWFVAQIPMLQMEQIKSAMISPLIEQ